MNKRIETLFLANNAESSGAFAVADELRRLHKMEALREKERKRLVRISFEKKDLLHALYTALPFIEDALDDATYNREKVQAKLNEIKAVIYKVERK